MRPTVSVVSVCFNQFSLPLRSYCAFSRSGIESVIAALALCPERAASFHGDSLSIDRDAILLFAGPEEKKSGAALREQPDTKEVHQRKR